MIGETRAGDVIFLDIETVPYIGSFDETPVAMRKLWDSKSKYFRNEEETPAMVWERAGIYAEFGKIICISAGIITGTSPRKLRLKSFYGDDERQLLTEFSSMLTRFRPEKEVNLCAHNGREFDFPYIARRMVIHRLPLPQILNTAGRKPWEIRLLDTMDMWKFGDYKHFTSLDLLTNILGIATPKDDLDGSMVAGTYWKDHDLRRIAVYCEKDVIAVAQVFLTFAGEPLISPEDIESVTTFPAA